LGAISQPELIKSQAGVELQNKPVVENKLSEPLESIDMAAISLSKVHIRPTLPPPPPPSKEELMAPDPKLVAAIIEAMKSSELQKLLF